MSFEALDPNMIRAVGQKLESLSKSFAAGYQGLSNAGRTGVSALAVEQLDDVLRSITMTEDDFLLTKDIPTLKATQSVYEYRVKTQVRSGVDLAGWEAFLPQEDTSQYMRVAEVLKVYGIRKSITQMAMFINDAGGYAVDLEKENDENAALAMAEALERDLYVGGDMYIGSDGNIDPTIAANINGPVRNVRGIQANIREGDTSMRGIPGDFIAYGNSRSVVFDRKGAVLERGFLDKVVTSVKDNRGQLAEAHCTTSQLAEFRATFFPIERADISALFAIRGPNVTNDEKKGISIDTVGGPLQFVPTVFKYMRTRPEMVVGSAGAMPNTPTAAYTSETLASGSGFTAGQALRYVVQAVNISGMSAPSAAVTHTVVAADAAINLTLTPAAGAQTEYFMVFRTPEESNGLAGTEMFVGKIALPRGAASVVFRDKNRIIPGLDGILMMPKNKDRAKLAILGNLLNKLELGIQGLAMQHVYASYCGVVVDRPRTFALVDNVYQQREGI